MATVGKAQDDREWKGWAATRDEFASIVRRMAALLAEGEERPTVLSIRIPGYERSFDSVDEFVENVSEDEWPTHNSASAGVHTAGWLTATLTVSASPYVPRVQLSVTGRDRRARNGLEPELAELVELYARPPRSVFRPLVALAALSMILAVPMCFAASVVLDAIADFPAAVTIPVAVIDALALIGWASGMVKHWVLKHVRSVELLPADGVSAWQRGREQLLRRASIAGAVTVGVATVAGTCFAAIAAFSG